MIGRSLFFALYCAFSLSLFAETNVLAPGLPVVLISSKEHAELAFEDLSVEAATNQRASHFCERLNKTLGHFKAHSITAVEAADIFKHKIYSARVVDDSQPGLVFLSGTFFLAQFKKPTPGAIKVAQGLYGGALVVFVSGGISTFLMATGFEGPADYFAAMICGAVTFGISSICTVSGLAVHWYHGTHADKSDEVNLTKLEKAAPIYAMPVLIDELFCK